MDTQELHFGDHVLDPAAGTLRGPRGEVRLRPKTFALLELLVARAPAVLRKGELVDRVWGQEHLGETSLAQAVSELRRALGDDPRCPRLIETVHRRGYRFIAAVRRGATTAGGLLPECGGTSEAEPVRSAAAERTAEACSHGGRERRSRAAPVARWRWPLFAAAALAAFALLLSPQAGPGTSDASPAALPAGPGATRLVLLPFTAAAGAAPLSWLESGLPSLLGTRLEKHARIYVYPQERAETMIEDLPFLRQPGEAAMAAAGRYLAADWLLRGWLEPTPEGHLRARIELRPVMGPEPPLVAEEEAPLEELAWLVQRLAYAIVHRVDDRSQPFPPARPRSYRLPVATFEDYFEAGRAASRDVPRALEILGRAARRSPESGHVATARCRLLLSQGRLAEARALARTSHRLTDDPRTEVWYLALLGRPQAALRRLERLPPKLRLDPEAWLDAVTALEATGQTAAALLWVDALPPPVRRGWLEAELALVESRAAQRLGDAERALAAGRRAVQAGRRRAHHTTVAEGSEQLADLARPRLASLRRPPPPDRATPGRMDVRRYNPCPYWSCLACSASGPSSSSFSSSPM